MKMIEITYRDTKWSDTKVDGRYTLLIASPETRKLLVNIDYIASISPTPTIAHKEENTQNLYFVNTQIASGLGLNGVDYHGYYVTEESYQKLVKNIEVL